MFEFIALIPAFAALSVGGMYVFGAGLKTAQLAAAGLTVSDTLPLIPLEQLLAAGIQAGLRALIVVAILATVAVAVGAFWTRRTRQLEGFWLPPGTPSRPAPARLKKALTLLLAVVAIVAWTAPPAEAVVAILTAVAVFTVIQRFDDWTYHETVRLTRRLIFGLLGCTFALVLGADLVDQVIEPDRLATVQIRPRVGEPVEGQLITTSGGMIFAGVRGRGVVGIPQTQTRSVRFVSAPSREKTSLFEHVFGLAPGAAAKKLARLKGAAVR
ncbi:hypothetical protein OJ997_06550 [Solirubrobacter phytolaccae]|uniref:Uncharacterized protein n=1 Tax=Solirubrobacter phytolaccae TaxID=1404360 RepID=A0A9X3N801_9ACTN|nr:hypothetical protein [Solirubrobacter phytolaccae]MDA0179947.1 hypothetical protein [Solirubrobacter phytolaccae]